MKTSHRRFALLSSASIAALGAASPAFAAVLPTVPVNNTGPSVTGSVVVCVDLSPVANCTFGANNTGTGLVTSIVNTPLTGQLEVTNVATAVGGDVTVSLGNTAAASVDAVAIANGPAGGLASAAAAIGTGIQFSGIAPDQVALTFTNSSPMLIDAFASATGGATGVANAQVTIGLLEQGVGADVALNIGNNAALSVLATANATATGTAMANALVFGGILQVASATGAGTANLTNSATIAVGASANALGAAAVANANVQFGVLQQALGGTAALASMTNSGTVAINATANATGTFTAVANANQILGLAQLAIATGTATAQLSNSGAIQLGVNAVASATSGAAVANANNIGAGTLDGAIVQVARGSTALASFVNTGTVSITAAATAFGATGAVANADVAGMFQAASGTIGAAVVATNNGTMAFTDVANATATAGPATANAIADGIHQVVAAGTTGTASYVNNGTVSVAAVANASGTVANANATLTRVVEQDVTVTAGTGVAAITNSGVLSGLASANAFGSATANADANITAGILQDVAVGTGTGVAFIGNSGTINITANASAVASTNANATAGGSVAAVSQNVAAGTLAIASLTNTGLISANANANASALGFGGSADAGAGMIGVYQAASGATASELLVNSGTIAVSAAAHAFGSVANALVIAEGAIQSASASTASQVANNVGVISVNGNASATAVFTANAQAVAIGGLAQTASAFSAVQSITNAGTVSINASAVASATFGSANAVAIAGLGLFQGASAAVASQALTNSGVVAINASALAVGPTGASALALAGVGFIPGGAVGQVANASSAVQFLSNAGTVTVNANASAVASGTLLGFGSANASALALGLFQSASVVAGSQSMVNSGFLGVNAHALASAVTDGFANADAFGALQIQSASTAAMAFSNSGTMSVNAAATVSATTGTANASAIGYLGIQTFGAPLTASVVNTGLINVAATAISPTFATAHAVGLSVVGGTNVATLTNAFPVSASIVNSGTINVTALASGGTFTTLTAGGGTTTLGLSSATATGIHVQGGNLAVNVDNSGSINVDAIATNNGTAEANGILIENNGAFVLGATDLVTVTNSGDIIVRESVDGGATFRRGMAIDVAGASAPAVINLISGNIYGNIDIKAGDNINVSTGTTYFDGIVNPECLPAGGLTAADLDDPAIEACGQGTLTIDNGGNLILADPRLTGDPTMYDGPAYVFVDTFNVGADGTITFQLQPAAGGTQPVGTYPQVFADTANLDGTLVAEFTPAGGLFANNYFYDNVIDATVRNGGFDGAQCVLGGAFSGSLLLDLDCIEEAGNIDLSLTRLAFDSVPGLNQNGTSVGAGLECIYDTALTGGIAGLLGDLFLFTDPVNFNIALNQLAGASYANYLQSFPSLGVHYNDLIAKATDCEIPALAGSVLECRASAPIHVWGQLDYQWRKADGDIEGGTNKSKRFTGLLGVDASVGNAAIVGISAGAVSNHTRDNMFGDKIDAGGMQLGAYGVYDPGAFYVKAVTTYSWYDGDSSRDIDFTGLAPGATFAGSTDGDPDVKMWTFGLHGGARFGLGGNSVLTPYLNYDYVNAKLQSFTESGLDGANLTVLGGRSKHSYLTGGVKWATQLGGVVPEVNLGYRYRMGNSRSRFSATFIGDTDCDFDVVSASQKRGTFLAGLSVGGKVGPVDLRIGYEGEFNSDITSHSGNFKFVLPLGSRAAPPPPPPPPAPVIAPPPPVEVAPPPPPPPPPPAPVERGERGQ